MPTQTTSYIRDAAGRVYEIPSTPVAKPQPVALGGGVISSGSGIGDVFNTKGEQVASGVRVGDIINVGGESKTTPYVVSTVDQTSAQLIPQKPVTPQQTVPAPNYPVFTSEPTGGAKWFPPLAPGYVSTETPNVNLSRAYLQTGTSTNTGNPIFAGLELPYQKTYGPMVKYSQQEINANPLTYDYGVLKMQNPNMEHFELLTRSFIGGGLQQVGSLAAGTLDLGKTVVFDLPFNFGRSIGSGEATPKQAFINLAQGTAAVGTGLVISSGQTILDIPGAIFSGEPSQTAKGIVNIVGLEEMLRGGPKQVLEAGRGVKGFVSDIFPEISPLGKSGGVMKAPADYKSPLGFIEGGPELPTKVYPESYAKQFIYEYGRGKTSTFGDLNYQDTLNRINAPIKMSIFEPSKLPNFGSTKIGAGTSDLASLGTQIFSMEQTNLPGGGKQTIITRKATPDKYLIDVMPAQVIKGEFQLGQGGRVIPVIKSVEPFVYRYTSKTPQELSLGQINVLDIGARTISTEFQTGFEEFLGKRLVEIDYNAKRGNTLGKIGSTQYPADFRKYLSDLNKDIFSSEQQAKVSIKRPVGLEANMELNKAYGNIASSILGGGREKIINFRVVQKTEGLPFSSEGLNERLANLGKYQENTRVLGRIPFKGDVPTSPSFIRPRATTVEISRYNLFPENNVFPGAGTQVDAGMNLGTGKGTFRVVRIFDTSGIEKPLVPEGIKSGSIPRPSTDVVRVGDLLAKMEKKGGIPAEKNTIFDSIKNIDVDLSGRVPKLKLDFEEGIQKNIKVTKGAITGVTKVAGEKITNIRRTLPSIFDTDIMKKISGGQKTITTTPVKGNAFPVIYEPASVRQQYDAFGTESSYAPGKMRTEMLSDTGLKINQLIKTDTLMRPDQMFKVNIMKNLQINNGRNELKTDYLQKTDYLNDLKTDLKTDLLLNQRQLVLTKQILNLKQEEPLALSYGYPRYPKEPGTPKTSKYNRPDEDPLSRILGTPKKRKGLPKFYEPSLAGIEAGANVRRTPRSASTFIRPVVTPVGMMRVRMPKAVNVNSGYNYRMDRNLPKVMRNKNAAGVLNDTIVYLGGKGNKGLNVLQGVTKSPFGSGRKSKKQGKGKRRDISSLL